jgi:uncharacterized protein (TIGR02145 family)
MAEEGTLVITISNQDEAPDVKSLAPDGWHIPSDSEFIELRLSIDPVGDSINNVAGGKMKSTDPNDWDPPNEGATNETGFNAKGCGNRSSDDGTYGEIKQNAVFWTTTEAGPTNARVVSLNYTEGVFVAGGWGGTKGRGYAIRCVKDSTSLTIGQTSTMFDIDGNVYPTKVMPDGKEWMCANLKVTKFNDGTQIPNVTDGTAWAALTTGAYCTYDNDNTKV